MANRSMRPVTKSRVCILEPRFCSSTYATAGQSRTPGTPRDTQLREDRHRYRESNSVRILDTLRSLAMNALQLEGYWSITDGLAALAHDIRGLLALLGW
jgi:hypothetical protein